MSDIDKSNYALLHHPKRNMQRFSFSLSISNHQLKREYCIKYLGLMIDSNLNCVSLEKRLEEELASSTKFVIMSLKTF